MPHPTYMLSVLAQAANEVGNAPADGEQSIFEFGFGAYVFAIVNFLVLVALLYKFLHKPLLDILEKRRERIEGKEEAADRKAEEADAARREYEQKVAGLQEERDRLLAEARKEADEKRHEILEEARAAAARQAENMKRDWQRQERDALDRLEEEILAASVDMVRRIVNKLTDADFEQRMEDRLLAQLDELAAREDETLRDELFGADVPVRVASARQMPPERCEAIRRRIQAIAGDREVQVEFSDDPTLVAGARVEFSSMAVDASLADILAAARERFDAVTEETATNTGEDE